MRRRRTSHERSGVLLLTFTSSATGARLAPVEERRLRIGSLFEWFAAALGVAGVIWLLSVPVQRMIGPRVEAALMDTPTASPAGIPAGATNVPVMLLLDGREIRHGELHTRLTQVLPDRLLSGPVVRSPGDHGERQTRTYVVQGNRFYVVCERFETGGPMRLAGIYLP